MEIIKHSKAFMVKCNYCRSVLRFTEKDVFEETKTKEKMNNTCTLDDQPDKETYYLITTARAVKCPVCNNIIFI